MGSRNEDVELAFCDICGVSIPEKDVEEGLTRRVEGRTIGACCLSKLQIAGPSPKAGNGAAAVGIGSLSVLGVVLVGAVLAAAWYLDQRAQERDPVAKLDTLQGKVKALEEIVSGQERVLRGWGTSLAREVEGKLGPAYARLEAELAKLKSALPKPDGAATAIKARVATLASQVGDLVARQSALESQIARSQASVTDRLEQVAQSLVDLRRRSVATRDAATGKAGAGNGATPGPNRRVEALPETLGRKVDQLDADDPGVRWDAVDKLVRSGDKRVVPYLLPKLEDADPFVRRLCAEGLPDVGDISVCGALIKALADKEAIVRESVYKSLVKLSKKRFPFDPEAKPATRESQLRKWRQWWKTRKAG